MDQSAPPSVGWFSGNGMFSLKLEGLNSAPGSLPGIQISKGDLISVLNMERRGKQALLGGAGCRKHQPKPKRWKFRIIGCPKLLLPTWNLKELKDQV